MITLAKDCLLFQMANGETFPFSADMISIELTDETARWFGPDVASHAAKAVFHYFKMELQRQSVTAEEFAGAMEKVLRNFKTGSKTDLGRVLHPEVVETDLGRLAQEAGGGCELLFFPKLRDEVRQHLRQAPRMLRFWGLRACVKQIAGVRRWTPRCRALEEQIVGFLRECSRTEPARTDFALLVE